MTTNLITSNTTSTIVAQSSGDTWIVAEDVYVMPSVGHAIDGTGPTDQKVFWIDGTLKADNGDAGIDLGDEATNTGGNNEIQISETGTVAGGNNFSDHAIESAGGDLYLVNEGTIRSTDSGVVAEDGFNRIANYGTVTTEAGTGILVDHGNNTVTNSGSIDAGFGIQLWGDQNSITNTGEITAETNGVRFSSAAGTTNELTNTGVIGGSEDVVGVRGNNGDETVVNRGLIDGEVDLRAGNDRVFNRDGKITEQIILGQGSDTFFAGASAEDVDGGSGTDTVNYALSDQGVEVRLGSAEGAGGDVLINFENVVGSAHADVISGNSADNLLDGGRGADMIAGGGGFDTASYIGSLTGVFVRLTDGAAAYGAAAGDRLTSIEGLVGSDYADILTGDAAQNTIDAGQGDDRLRGGASGDTLNGGSGFDIAYYIESGTGVSISLADGTTADGTAAGDTLTSIEGLVGSDHADILTGDAVGNTIRGGDGGDTIDGGGGFDTAYYTGSLTGVFVRLTDGATSYGTAAGDTLTSIEGLVGSDHADILIGDAAANTIEGSQGDDELRGGDAGDAIDGGDGFDTVYYIGSGTGVDVSLADGTTANGSAAGDTLTSIEGLVGSDHGDTLIGDDGTNEIKGGQGDDQLRGGDAGDAIDGGGGVDTASYSGSGTGVYVRLTDGATAYGTAAGDTLSSIEGLVGSDRGDVLIGDAGNNVIDGGKGNDRLRGDSGDDTLTGGAGQDSFYFEPGLSDVTVTDFEDGTDLLNFSAFNFSGFQELNDKATMVGSDLEIDLGSGDIVTLVGISKSQDFDDSDVII